MSLIARFVEYAAAFEKAYASDDWTLVEPFFTEDAEYEILGMPAPLGGRFSGRAAILAYFQRVLDGFDRRFASREVGLVSGPREDAGSVWLRGSVVYTAAGVPDLRFELEETATFAGDRIRRLEDRYDPETVRAVTGYAREFGGRLGLTST